MIISIYGLSGSGKSTLAMKLADNLTNAIHIDLDELNRDLMQTDGVITKAKEIFGQDITTKSGLDSKKILDQIMQDISKYNLWTDYMINACNVFLQKYIARTTFDYYILDHLNSHKLKILGSDILYIECKLDKASRLDRLKNRENISEQTLEFRDKNYIAFTPDIIYNNTNYDEIIYKILQHKI